MCTKRIHIMRLFSSLFIIWVLMSSVISPITKAENKYASPVPKKVIMGGFPFGTRIKTHGVLVVDVKEVDSNLGIVAPAKDAGIIAGDIIVKVNGNAVHSVGDVSESIAESGGETVDILLLRNNEEINVKLTPVLSRDRENYKSGLWIRDGAAGIGTVTCVLPDSLYFAGLGHGICDMDTGKLIPFDKGEVFDVKIYGIVKGEKGKAGELHGQLDVSPIGTLHSNLHTGVFGKYNTEIPNARLIEVGKREEVKVGKCLIYSTLGDTGVEEIEAEITKILDTKARVKNFLVTITDKDFLEKTGGIIQGMSGSPLIQNGKLIGAVTHVLVDDPTRGYGIFIENMMANMPE